MKYFDLSKINHSEKMIYNQLAKVPDDGSIIRFMISNALQQGDHDRYKMLIEELYQMCLDNRPMMEAEIGRVCVDMVTGYFSKVMANYQMIERCISNSMTQLHLEQCSRMAEDRMAHYPTLHQRLLRDIQFRQVELQCFVYA